MATTELNEAALAAGVSHLRLPPGAFSARDALTGFRFMLDAQDERGVKADADAALTWRLAALAGRCPRAPRHDASISRYTRLALVGTNRAARFAAALLGRHHRIIAFLDPRAQQSGETVDGVEVRSLDALNGLGCDAVLIASPDAPDVAAQVPSGPTRPPVFRLRDVFDRLVVFGAGTGGQQVLDGLPDSRMVLCFADNDPAKQGTVVRSIPVVAPAALAALDFDYAVIGSIHGAAIERQLRALGVAGGKLLSCDPQWASPAPVVRRSLPMTRVRRFDRRLTAADVARAASFGSHCRSAVLLSFDAVTIGVGTALAAAGCRVIAFGAPWFADGLAAGGITARTSRATREVLSQLEDRTAVVVGEAGVPSWLPGALRPSHKLIVPNDVAPPGAHVSTDHLTFWYAPAREWLAAADSELEPCP